MIIKLRKIFRMANTILIVARACLLFYGPVLLNRIVYRASHFKEKAGKTKECLSLGNFREILTELSENDSFNYINDGTLTENYFKRAEETLSDKHLYVVISRTGGPAFDIISVFTSKSYNHASLAFDRELNTAVSYNSGNYVYPPGMNPENHSDFTKKDGDSFLVYSLPCSSEKKSRVLEQIREINESGSAYNLIGLMMKKSYRPNIMFCSQFVYKMLDLAGLSYFSMKDGRVKPTDFIELDYRRTLRFEYEVGL